MTHDVPTQRLTTKNSRKVALSNLSTRSKAIIIVLRITVALQCLGNAWWFLWVDETPLLSLMWGQADVGGWGWSETSALAVQQVIGWYAVVAAILVLIRPSGWVLWPLFLLQLSIAGAMCRMHLGFQPGPNWLAPQIASLFPWATHSARIAAPLVLWMLDPRALARLERLGESCHTFLSKTKTGMNIIRGSIALMFLAHGIEALSHHPVFMDLIIVSARICLGWNMPEHVAEPLLTAIGMVDIVIAGLCLIRRWPAVAWYMAFWGGVTAASRVIAGGWEFHWHELAIRSPHAGLPLVLALYWMYLASALNNPRGTPP